MGFAPGPLLEILHARSGGGALHPEAEATVVVGYLEAVARVTAYVDRLVHGAGPAG